MNDTTQPTSGENDDARVFLELIFDEISPRISLMKPGETIKAKGLFDPEFWKTITDQERIEIGSAVVRLVAQGRVPLENLGASPRTGNHVVYPNLVLCRAVAERPGCVTL